MFSSPVLTSVKNQQELKKECRSERENNSYANLNPIFIFQLFLDQNKIYTYLIHS